MTHLTKSARDALREFVNMLERRIHRDSELNIVYGVGPRWYMEDQSIYDTIDDLMAERGIMPKEEE